MSARPTPPSIDPTAIAALVETLFRRASGGFVQFRAFVDDRSKRNQTWGKWPSVEINGAGLQPVIDAAVSFAGECAAADMAVCYAPPIATFIGPHTAAEKDIYNGLVLSVELDENPSAAREKLENVLGRATLVEASGGQWPNPDTGELEDKLHCHWGLKQATETFADHVRLKEGREIAAVLVGADKTAVTPVHPMRWAGSVWSKDRTAPRLARIVALNKDAEIDLGEALRLLREAVAASGGEAREDHTTHDTNDPQADFFDTCAALEAIPNGNLPWDDWNRIGMATWRATGGSEAGFHAFDAWSRKSGKYDRTTTRERWDHIAKYPPSRIGFGTLDYEAKQARPGWRRPSVDFVARPFFRDQPRDEQPEEDFNRDDPPAPETCTAQAWIDRDLPDRIGCLDR